MFLDYNFTTNNNYYFNPADGNNPFMNNPNMERQNTYPPQGQKPPYDSFTYQKSTVHEPGKSAYYREVGNTFYLQKDYEKAIESYTKGIVIF